MNQPHYDLVCLSHLRWEFVWQRPQHLLSRCARDRRVLFVEEPVFDAPEPRVTRTVRDGVTVAVPHLPPDLSEDEVVFAQRRGTRAAVAGSAPALRARSRTRPRAA